MSSQRQHRVCGMVFCWMFISDYLVWEVIEYIFVIKICDGLNCDNSDIMEFVRKLEDGKK